MTPTTRVFRFAAMIGITLAWALPATAQSLFSPAVRVNDKVVTYYEIEQRARMMTLLRAPGDPQKEARKQLIEERLKMQAAGFAGIELTDEIIETGMEEFAGRANMKTDQFVKALAQGGVARETFRDFVGAGQAWRELVRAKFYGRVQISENEIDRALANAAGAGGVQVLLSEIIMPATPQNAAEVQARAAKLSEIDTLGGFAAAARQYSASPTARRGGRINWMPIANLPPALRPMVLGLAPGEVSDPIPLPTAVALFQMRAIEEFDSAPREFSAIEYAALYLPGGRSEATLAKAASIRERADTCDDLYGLARDMPPEALERISRKPQDIPGDVAVALSNLDKGEMSTALTRSGGETLMVLMMCGRTEALTADASREEVAAALRNARLESYAQGYLEQLRADARIEEMQ